MTTQGRIGTILVIWLAGLAAAAQYGKISVTFHLMPGLFPVHAAQLGWTVSLVGFVGLLFGVAAGALVSSLGFRRTLVWSLAIGAAMSALQALGLGFWPFLLTRVIEGASHLGVVVTAPTLIAQVSSPRHRGAALTLWSTFFAVSYALLAWFGVPYAQAQGIEALFALHAVLMALMALALAWVLRQVPVPTRRPMPDLAGLARQHVAIYGSAARMSAAAGWLFYTASFVALLTVLPQFLDPGSRGAVMTAMPLASIAVSMTLGVWMLRVMPAVGVVMLGFGLSALSVGWMWLAPGDPLACLAVAGAMGLVQGASFAVVPQINAQAEHQGQANGAVSQAGNLGNTIGTPLMLAVVSAAGYEGMVALLALLFAGGLAVHLVLAQARRKG